MNDEQKEALRAVVEYMRDAEWTNYCESTGAARELHIWHAVQELSDYLSNDGLSALQAETLKRPCPYCGKSLQVVGDLADPNHDLVTCTQDACGYVVFFDGTTMDN